MDLFIHLLKYSRLHEFTASTPSNWKENKGDREGGSKKHAEGLKIEEAG